MYRTETGCGICNHEKRIDIEKLYEDFTAGALRDRKTKKIISWTAFCKKGEEDFDGPSQQSFRTHFKGVLKKGKRYPSHYGVKAMPGEGELGSVENRKFIEQFGLEFIRDQLELYRKTDVKLPVSQITQLYKALVSSQDKTKELELKELELSRGRKNTKDILQGAIYGGLIKEAQTDDTSGDDGKSDAGGTKALASGSDKGA